MRRRSNDRWFGEVERFYAVELQAVSRKTSSAQGPNHRHTISRVLEAKKTDASDVAVMLGQCEACVLRDTQGLPGYPSGIAFVSPDGIDDWPQMRLGH